MITTEDEFTGRTREISNILSRLKNCNSVSVVGERRIGKSSLLYHLFLTGNKRLNDPGKTAYRFIFIDALSALFSTPADFAVEVLQTLDVDYNQEEMQEFPLKALTRGLNTFKERGIFPILLIDEFGKLSEKKEIFTDDFFEGIRSCCNGGCMAIVTASQHTLKELTDRNNLTSPFWNIFTNVPLRGFTVDDNMNEVIDFIRHFWYKLTPADKEVLFLLNYWSNHPLILQVVSFHLFWNRSLGLDDKRLKKAIEGELLSFFRSGSENITRWFKRKARISDRIDKGTEYIGRQVKNLGSVFDYFKGMV